MIKKAVKKELQKEKPKGKRGGIHDLRIARDGQTKLLQVLIEAHGGPTIVATKLGVKASIVFSWRSKGVIPLRYVKRVADSLACTPWGLNYRDLCFFEQTYPSWVKVVNSYKLPKNVTDEILGLPAPEVDLVEQYTRRK